MQTNIQTDRQTDKHTQANKLQVKGKLKATVELLALLPTAVRKMSLRSSPPREGTNTRPFSAPETAIVLDSTKNRDLWPPPTPEVRDSRTRCQI